MKPRTTLFLAASLLLGSSLACAQSFPLNSGAWMKCRGAPPIAPSGTGITWCKSSDANKLYYTTPAGVSAALGGGGSTTGDIVPDADKTRVLGAAATGRYLRLFTVEVDSGGTDDLLFQTNNFDRLLLGRTTSNVLTSGVSNGASAVGNVLGTFNTFSTAGAKLLSVQNNTAERAYVGYDGAIVSSYARAISTAQTLGLSLENTTAATTGAQQYSPMSWLYGQRFNGSVTKAVGMGWQAQSVGNGTDGGYIALYDSYDGAVTQRFRLGGDPYFGAGYYALTSTDGNPFAVLDAGHGGILMNSGTIVYTYISGNATSMVNATKLGPVNDFGLTSGASAARWSETWSRRYAGVEQTVAAAATITLDPASGEQIRITLGATGITTINGAAGYPGEQMCVEVIQDGTGSRTISGWSTGANGFLLAGGAYTATTTLNKRDQLCFRWDSVASRWVEMSRSMNL